MEFDFLKLEAKLYLYNYEVINPGISHIL